MFGVIFIFGIIIYGIVMFFRNVKEDMESQHLYKNDASNTYIASDLTHRDLSTGRYRNIYTHNGDKYMEGDDIGVVNLSQIERDEQYEYLREHIPKGRTTIYYSPGNVNLRFAEGGKEGKQYRDLKTGEIYLVRENAERKLFYVDFNNKVIRYTDRQRNNMIEDGRYNEEQERKDVEEFQKAIDNVGSKDFWRHDPTRVCTKAGMNFMNDDWRE